MTTEILEFVEKQVLMTTHPKINWKTVRKKGLRYLGHTATLSKVLNAIFSNEVETSIKMIYNGLQITTNLDKEKISFCWIFLMITKKGKHFRQECHFRDQSEETKLLIAKILSHEKSKLKL